MYRLDTDNFRKKTILYLRDNFVYALLATITMTIKQ